MPDCNSPIDINNAVGNDVITFDASKQIHTDITSRLGRCISPRNGILAQISSCANEQVMMAQQQFVSHPDRPTAVEDFLCVQACRLLPDEIRGAGGNDDDTQLLKSLLGMLKAKEDCFTPEDKKRYEQVCQRLLSAKPWDGEIKTQLKNDDKLWQPLTPLIEKYGEAISEDLMAHMLDQSVNAWCHYHNNASRDWAINNLDKVFSTQVRVCFHMLDFHNKKLSKASTELNNGTLLRHRMMEIMSVIGTIPLTLHRRENIPAKIQTPAPETEVREEGNKPQAAFDSPGSPAIATMPKSINIYGSSASAKGGSCCCHEKSATSRDEPWSALVEKLLASDKLSDKQCFELIKALIHAMAGNPGVISQALKNDSAAEELANIVKSTPLLSSLYDVKARDVIADATPTVIKAPTSLAQHVIVKTPRTPDLPEIPEPDYMVTEAGGGRNTLAFLNQGGQTASVRTSHDSVSSSSEPLKDALTSPLSSPGMLSSLSALSDEILLHSRQSGLRKVRSITSVDSGLSARSPLSNFSLATWEERRINGAPRVFTLANDKEVEASTENMTPLSHRRQQLGLSLPLATSANDENLNMRHRDERQHRSISPTTPISSMSNARQTGLSSEEAAILKQWLKAEAQDYDEELNAIDALQPDGLRITTLEHFLESAFIASPGTERRSDLRQRYIRDAFNRLKTHSDYDVLSERTRILVDRYALKRNSKVFATSPTRVSYLQNGFF